MPELQEVGVKLAEIDDFRDAGLRLICDRSIHGRAVGIWENSLVDLGDDLRGDYCARMIRSKVEEGAMVRFMAQVSRMKD